LQNVFLPSVKLIRKEPVGARVRRRYDAACTPLERVLASPAIDPARAAELRRQRDHLDPFALARTIEQKLERIYALANAHLSPGAAPSSGPTLPVRRRAGKRLSINPNPRGSWPPGRPVTSRTAR
jgi:hypothetical protein